MSNGHQFTEVRQPDLASLPKNDEPALGQVLVIPFEEDWCDLPNKYKMSLDDLMTILIIKPHFEPPYFKFIGGMLKHKVMTKFEETGSANPLEETFKQAVADESMEEAGIIIDPKQLVQAKTIKKRQHAPHVGTFDLRLYLAFGCDFKSAFNPLWGEVGDEGEVAMQVRFGDITVTKTWPIPTEPSREVGFFPYYLGLELVEAAKDKIGY